MMRAMTIPYEPASARGAGGARDRAQPPAAPSTAAPRWHARYASPVWADVAGTGVLLCHPVEDLSMGGACVQTPIPEPVGGRVQIALSLARSGSPLVLEAEVVWTRAGRMGLRWLGLNASRRRQLAALIAQSRARAISPAGHAAEPPRA